MLTVKQYCCRKSSILLYNRNRIFKDNRMKHYKLFIDESGHSHQNHPSKYFVLVGCIVEDAKQDVLKIKADQLKYKYWNKTDIVFHSEEIGKRVGAFKQFAGNSQLAKQFEKQLLQ